METAEVKSFVLGGKDRSANRAMRDVLAEAATLRLTQAEEDIMKQCGEHNNS
jgi:hypothetical protein